MRTGARVATLMLVLPLAVLGLGGTLQPAAQDPATAKRPRVLILTGQNNHDWPRTSAMIRVILEEPNLFELETWSAPGADTPTSQVHAPDFHDFAVVVWDYNPGGDYKWPEALRAAWIEYIRGGGRAFLIHASNNPFPGWTEFEEMVGLLWRGADAGEALEYDDEGEPVRTPAGEGSGAGHGRLHDFRIHHREPDHPVLAGLPETWLHASDELYHWQRGPRPDTMEVLATAWDDPEYGGTGLSEPMLWQIPYGDGVVMTWLPGHLWRGQDDVSAYRCVGFRTIIQRAVEWLATGSVTQSVPENFPTADRVSLTARPMP
ncbi:MAG: ThuA domain-containing protein [Phycisphaerales bacterium]